MGNLNANIRGSRYDFSDDLRSQHLGKIQKAHVNILGTLILYTQVRCSTFKGYGNGPISMTENIIFLATLLNRHLLKLSSS